MSNKALRVILVTTTLLIVIAGAFSGGFLVGNVYQKASQMVQIFPFSTM